MFGFGMVKFVNLLLTGPFIESDCSRYQCSSERGLILLRKIRKIERTFKSVQAIHSVRPIQVRGTEVWLYFMLKKQINLRKYKASVWKICRCINYPIKLLTYLDFGVRGIFSSKRKTEHFLFNFIKKKFYDFFLINWHFQGKKWHVHTAFLFVIC